MGKNNDKARVILAGTVIVMVILTSIIFASTLMSNGKTISSILPMMILAIVMIFMIPFVKRRYFDVKAGYPYEDERSKKIMTKAMATSYIISIYWMLALMFYTGIGVEDHGLPPLIPRHVAVLGIAGMAVIFGLSYIYVSLRGKIE
ncbi:hypothetical protein ACFLRF_00450 [Candidatus Altiarchaeota archaeon]